VTHNVAYIFNPNVDVQIKARICKELNIMAGSISDNYLGLASMVGLDRMDNFVYLLECIIDRFKGWKRSFYL
jgi:hypothetical protein